MTLARTLGGVGRLFIWVGSIILLFVAYQLWGTGIAEARAQSSLESDFEELLADFDVTAATVVPTTAPSATPTSTAPTATTAPPPPPDDGDAVARIVIPKIGVDKIIVEGVSRSDLQKGPGHYPGTPLPGQAGNASIAGHRTTYGAPFFRVDELEVGDEILVTTLQGSFKYIVSGQSIVAPSEVSVIDDFGDNRLTLTSCHPKYTARERIIITAMLEEEPAPAPPSTVPPIGDGIPGDPNLPGEQVPGGEFAADATEFESLDAGETRTAGGAVLWGLILFAIWIIVYALSREWKKWPAIGLGAPVFAYTMFVFFENVSQALPANF